MRKRILSSVLDVCQNIIDSEFLDARAVPPIGTNHTLNVLLQLIIIIEIDLLMVGMAAAGTIANQGSQIESTTFLPACHSTLLGLAVC
jgi:hypothetical protein